MKQQETAILAISDLHYGKQTESYDTDVFRKRMDELLNKVTRIKELHSDYDFDELVIFGLGDFNDGSGIFPTQSNYQEITNPEQQADELADFLTEWTQALLEVWPKVRWELVPGNHGRTGKFVAEAANWDMVAYRFLQKNLKDVAEVNFNETGDPFIRKVEIRGHQHLLYHAHDIRSWANIPWYGIFTRLQRWYMSKLGPFDVAWMGHFHTSGVWKLNKIKAVLTGCMPTDDEWALRTLGMEASNDWWLCGCNNTRPLTFTFSLEVA